MNCKALAVRKSGRTLKTLLTAIVVFASMITGMAQVPSYVPANGLVGWWPFNGNANDESGNGNNGTVNGATLTSDRFGNANAAYSFDGISNTISTQLISPILSDWTISFYFRSSNIDYNFQGQNVIGLGSDVFGYGAAGFQFSGQVLPGQCPNFNYLNQMYLFDASQVCGGNFVNGGLYNNGTWYHVVMTKASLNYELKINNITVDTSILEDINIDQLVFGNRVPNIFQFFNGNIDDIGIWNRALTQNEITQLYTGSPCVNYQVITVTDTLIINANLTGVNPVTFQNSIKVYPNPSSTQITIDFGSNYATMTGYTMRIQNAVGQTVYTTGVTQQQFTSNLSTWTGNGIYFVYLIDAQGNTVDVKKIILQ
jgi:hypothetical protein